VNPADWPGGLAYLIVFIAAILEGEVIFITAAVAVAEGHLSGTGVFLAAALGGATGDQFFYYIIRGALHGHLRRWLERFPALARRHGAIVERVRRHQVAMVLACRFMPGLRVAISAACAYARVPAWLFSLGDLISALAWAAVIMTVVAWGGPAVLERVGLHGWWSAIVPAVLLLLFFWWLGRETRKLEVERDEEPSHLE
jgi:membrane protein DedA with SNARE-associated domain